MNFRPFVSCLALAGLVALPQAAHSFSGGISSGVLGPSGCNTCHTGGTAPTLSLNGPTTVIAGTTTEYLLIITSPPGQLSGGFNASSLLGDMSVGGSESAMTQVTASGGGNNDVTHLGAKAGNGTDVRFSFLWEAPGSAGPATIEAWGNAVNGNGNTTGDASSFTSLGITVDPGAPPLVPATSPWAQTGMIALLLAAGSFFLLRRRSSLF